MNIRSETMERLAALSKLEFSSAELEQLSGELETVVSYMDILSQFQPETVECAQGASLPRSVFREDRAACSRDRAELLFNAPSSDGETLTVPKAVD